MKNFFGLLMLLFVLNSCDDGDVAVQEIKFEDVQANTCGDLIFKIKGNEVMIIRRLQSSSNDLFENEPTKTGLPRLGFIGTDVAVTYRLYSSAVTQSNFCSLAAPTPNLIEEWTATSGQIAITTNVVKSAPDAVTNATRISSYNHFIVFKGVNFQKPVGSQLYENYIFGNYGTSLKNALSFSFSTDLVKCATASTNGTTTVYKQLGSEAMVLNIDSSLIPNSVNSSPRIGLISATTNKFSYKIMNGAIPANFFCGSLLVPSVVESWDANNGVASISGIVKVTTTTNGTGFSHNIHLLKATLKKGNSDFYLADDYNLGDLLTN